MSIRWEELKTAEKGWCLNHHAKEQIFQNCIRGKKVTRFSWRVIVIPVAYVGVAAAMIVGMLFLWPHFRRPQGHEIIIEGAASDPFVDENDPFIEQPTPDDITQTPSDSTEEQPTENPEDQPQETEKQETEMPSDSMVKRVESNDYTELLRITKGELGELFDYEIYYYQIENFYIEVDGKEMELRQALKKDPKILDALYAEWKEDFKDSKNYAYDGGTATYHYESYTVIKMNRMRVSVSPEDYSISRDNVDKSLILCSPSANDDADDRIMLGVTDFGIDRRYDQYYKSTVETEPYPPSFVLRKNGRFAFKFSNFSSFLPQGTYTIEGGKLTLQTQGEFDYKYVFEEVENGWRFIAKESAEIPSFLHGENTEPICPVPDGTIFKIS